MSKLIRYSQLTHQQRMAIYNDIKSDLFLKKEIKVKHNISDYTLYKTEREIEKLIQYKLYGVVPKEPTECNICGGKVKFNKCSKDKSKSGFVYYCTNCHAWVSTSIRNPREALGELGNHETRTLRRELHTWFDKLWRNREERAMYYDKLAVALNKSECHFSQMTMEELKKSLELVKKWWFEKYDR